jgi:hypothetical protein
LRFRVLPVLVGAGVLCFSQSAYAATLTVDDDRADCPAAAYTSVQAAVDAARSGDTITICPGAYVEGTGEAGTSAVLIQKNLTIKGAGADLVTITPKSSGPASGRILEQTPDLRNGYGDIVAIVGTPSQPLKVDISGVTVDGWDPQGRPVAVEAGIVFLDARGSVVRSHVTNIVTSEGDTAYTKPGGYRGDQPGIGIVQTTNALYAPVDGARQLRIERTKVDKYNKIGVLIDGAVNDAAPFSPSGTVDWGVIIASQIIGRTQCINYQGTGNCSLNGSGTPGGPSLSTGPLFGQDGLRVTAGSYATVESSTISQNLVLGTGAPVKGTTTNNDKLTLGAGVRYLGAKLNDYTTATGKVNYSHISTSNIMDNAYGALNLQLDGTTAATGNVNASPTQSLGNLLVAENNWWGLYDIAATNPGPAISPTTNPNAQENGVNGTATVETATGATTSNAVDFYPYRNGSQGNPDTGQFPVLTAPLPISDAAPTVGLSVLPAARPGDVITLTATPADDIGVKRVRFTDGSTTIGTVSAPPYSQTFTIPANAACNSTRTFTAIATDSANQTGSASRTLIVACQQPGPGASATATVTVGGEVTPTPNAPADPQPNAQAQAKAPVQTAATTKRLKPSVSLKITSKPLKGGKLRRTITGTIKLPSGISRAEGCVGSVSLVVKRSGRSLLKQQVPVSERCTFSRSLTSASSKQTFSAQAKFGGNAVLASADGTRRFS